MAKFEKVSRFKDEELLMPERKTAKSAGYDMAVAEDIIIIPYEEHIGRMIYAAPSNGEAIDLNEMAARTKAYKTKPTLVSTGMKCKLAADEYLELSVRSSCPLKYWLTLANSVGIIDADYYNNEDNEGEIFFQIINLSPYPIQLRKGDIIGQGIIHKFVTTEDDKAEGVRKGGFGSTTLQGGLASAT